MDPIERPATRRGFARVTELVRDRGVERVVVGLPLGLSGADTDQTRETRAVAARRAGDAPAQPGGTRAFAARLADAVAVPVEMYDERFTTAIAARAGGERSS